MGIVALFVPSALRLNHLRGPARGSEQTSAVVDVYVYSFRALTAVVIFDVSSKNQAELGTPNGHLAFVNMIPALKGGLISIPLLATVLLQGRFNMTTTPVFTRSEAVNCVSSCMPTSPSPG